MQTSIWNWSDAAAPPEPEDRPLDAPEPVLEVMDVESATDSGGVRVFRGRLRKSSSAVYERLKRAFAGRAVPMLQPDPNTGAAIALVPGPIEEESAERPLRPWLHWGLFALTLLTTTFAGAAHQGINLLRQPERFT